METVEHETLRKIIKLSQDLQRASDPMLRSFAHRTDGHARAVIDCVIPEQGVLEDERRAEGDA